MKSKKTKDELVKKRIFFRSSLSRLQIPFNQNIHNFIEYLIHSNCICVRQQLTEIDQQVLEEFYKFTN